MTQLLDMKKSDWKATFDSYGKRVVKEAVAAVNKGAEALDDYTPGWVNKISLETLDLSDTESCICGQLFVNRAVRGTGSYDDNGFPEETPRIFRHFDGEYGFDSSGASNGEDIDYELLDFLWSNLIEHRLLAQKDLLYAETFGKKPKVTI